MTFSIKVSSQQVSCLLRDIPYKNKLSTIPLNDNFFKSKLSEMLLHDINFTPAGTHIILLDAYDYLTFPLTASRPVSHLICHCILFDYSGL